MTPLSTQTCYTAMRLTPLPIRTRLTRWSLIAVITALAACASVPTPSSNAAPALIPVRDLVAGTAVGCVPHLVLTGKAASYRGLSLPDGFPDGTLVHDDLAAFAQHLVST